MVYQSFEAVLKANVEQGDRFAQKYLRKGKIPLALALEDARKQGVANDLIARAEEKGMLTGDLALTYAGAERIYTNVLNTLVGPEASADYRDLFEAFDPITDHDLIATGIFTLIPEVREKVAYKLERLYRVVLEVGRGRRKGVALPVPTRSAQSDVFLLPERLERLVAAADLGNGNANEYQRAFRVLIQKKAEREIFPVFQRNQAEAFDMLERRIAGEQNSRIRDMYAWLKDTYNHYASFAVPGVNPDFIDPETGNHVDLPSLHQRIAIYHLLKEKKFGIFDGCGTGKTAIGALAQPLMAQGREDFRTIVICPNLAKKAWKRGLIGPNEQRYLAAQQNIVVVNGEAKTDEFLDRLKDAQWAVINYEQLATRVRKKHLVDHLLEMGLDYLIVDESHHIKSLRTETGNGRFTRSAATQMLAHNAEYLALLTATPVPDKIQDYAVLYHLLHPDILPNPAQFEALHQQNPRVVYTLFLEKTIRRSSEDLNSNLAWEENDVMVDLTDAQRKIYQFIVERRPPNWLPQARKALLDPRLVDPALISQAGVTEQLTYDASAKYHTLEERLSAPNGPLAQNEKFVIFSSVFREGVTQEGNEKVRAQYVARGELDTYTKLGLERSLAHDLEARLRARFKRPVRIGVIDGTIGIEERERIVEQLGKTLDGILCTTDTAGESLDFTAASYGFVLDEDYTPKTMEQALARIIRKGQRKKVYIDHIRARETLDEQVRDYVDKKRILTQIAMDGYPLTSEETALLEDTHGNHLAQLIKGNLGGASIDVTDAVIEQLGDYELKRRQHFGRAPSEFTHAPQGDTTDAQRIMQWIGKDPAGCWHNPEFAALYVKAFNNLGVHIVHQAKIVDLARRALDGNITFPETVLSDGAGNSILYGAYQALEPLLNTSGLRVPFIVDRDFAYTMLQYGKNPNRIVGNMTGEHSTLKTESFDMVDNESISLLGQPALVKSALLEANRVLRPNGLLELVVQNMRFMPSFYSGLEKLGFEVQTEKHQGFAASKQLFKRLRREHGEHFAEAFANKLSNTYMLIATKRDAPVDAPAEDFWFERPGVELAEPTAPTTSARESFLGKDFVPLKDFAVDVKSRRRGTKVKKTRIALPGEIRGLSERLQGNVRVEE